jgi:integrase
MARKNTINFTKKNLDNLPIPKGDERPSYYDEQVNGLLVRVTNKGTRSYMVFRRINGKPKKTTLGIYPNMTIEQARSEAIKILGLISEGINPNSIKEGQLTKQTLTLEKVFKDYQRSRGTNLEDSTIKGYQSIINNQLSEWKLTPLSEIKQSMIEDKFLEVTHGTGMFIEKDASPTRANTMIRVLRALYNYAMVQYVDSQEEPLILHNPTKIISHNKSWNREKGRTGVVKDYNLKAWFEGVMKLPEHDKNKVKSNSSEVVRDFFIFLMFTGLRRNEALELKWEDIDLREKSFTIEDTKNHETHKMPLTWLLLELLERRKNDNGNPYVFVGEKIGSHLSPPKKQLEKARELVGFHFTNHDIRRTFTTTANRLNFNKYVLDRLVNHKNSVDSRDVTKRYVILDIEDLREPMTQITDSIWSQIQ